MISDAPSLFATERKRRSSSAEGGRCDSHLERSSFEALQHLADPPREASSRDELREEVAEWLARLEPPIRFGEHQLRPFLLEQLHRIHGGVSRTCGWMTPGTCRPSKSATSPAIKRRAELLRALSARVAGAHDADLAQDAQKRGPARDAGHLESALQASSTRRHRQNLAARRQARVSHELLNGKKAPAPPLGDA
jgi:hypothetical protein